MSGVKVAVRVRCWMNTDGTGDVCCVEMNDPETKITDLHNEEVKNDEDKPFKKMTFDYSFWSHDGFVRRESDGYCEPDGPGSKYHDQAHVYKVIGVDVLNSAWEGFHVCLFAYGQTGSGKSYSMTGYGANKGVIPLATTEIFERIQANTDPELTYQVEAQVCEIYNEKVQDLVCDPKKRSKEGLKIRESKALGIYVEGLSKHPVTNYAEIERVMATADSNRSVEATLMNATSSRAHTVTMITFTQVTKHAGKTAKKVSMINLIDLAVSEKNSQTGATGDRLKEASAINGSLSALGNVIRTLVDVQNGVKGKVIPYRDSKLTRMLQNALGGNSKTYLICAIRPGARFYEETASTMRFANDAKKLKNKAIINEDPMAKMIRELKAENDKLKALLAAGGGSLDALNAPGGGGGPDPEAEAKIKAMQEQLEANRREMEEMSKSWEDKVAEAKQREEEEKAKREADEQARLQGTPHLINLNEDPMLDRKAIYDIKIGESLTAGRRSKASSHKLQLGGVGVQTDHVVFECDEEGNTTLRACNTAAADQLRVNGKKVGSIEPIVLKPNDRICIGPSAVFLYKNIPKEAECASMPDDPADPISYDLAAEEIFNAEEAEKAGGDQASLKAIQEQQLEEMKKLFDEQNSKLSEADEARMAELKRLQEEIGKSGTDEEKKALEEKQKALEKELEDTKNNMSDEAKQKQKDMLAAGIRQKMIQAELARVERSLNELLPMVNEANLAAQELGRKISFATKIDKQIDPFLEGGATKSKTSVMVRVDNKEAGYFYDWPADKFKNRIFLIRDVLDDYFDTGDLPEVVDETDPFWDPPNPVLIGQSFIQLEPLGLQFENFIDATILSIDGAGGSQGQLTIGYAPCTAEGVTDEEELDEDFMVNDCQELIGKENLHFKVYIKNAIGLPKNLCTNPFVNYQFKFDDTIYRTDAADGNTQSPTWGYEKQHCIPTIDKAIAANLKEGVISFQLYAYAAGAPVEKKSASVKPKSKQVKQEVNLDKELGNEQEVYVPPPMDNKAPAAPKADLATKLTRKATLKTEKNLNVKAAEETTAGKKEDFVVKDANVKKAAVVEQKSGCCTIF